MSDSYQKATLARLFDHLVGAQQEAYIPFRHLLWCSTCVIVGSTSVVYDMASDEEVGRQILSIFMQHKVWCERRTSTQSFHRSERCRFPTGVEQGC
jgi:hypothetical protein